MWQRLAILLFLLLSVSLAQAAPTTPTTDFIDNNDGTVTHKITGLAWKRCSEGQTWSGGVCTGTAQTYTWAQATALTSTFAGKNDWRLPTIAELVTIVERNATNPAINGTLFPNTPALFFWSSSDNSVNAWGVNFNIGLNFGSSLKSGLYHARLIRGGQPRGSFGFYTPATDFTDHGNGTVTHNKTSLIWKRCAEGQIWNGSACTGTAATYTWTQATSLAQSYAGQIDWRLPTENELLTIVEWSTTFPAINPIIFPDTPTDNVFWSSSAAVDVSDAAWLVSFTDGYGSRYGNAGSHAVRLVRGGLETIPIKMTIDGPDALIAGNSATYSSASVTMSDGSSKKVSTLNWICSPGALFLGYDMAQSRPYNTKNSAGIGINVYSCLVGDMLTLHAGSQNGDDSYTIRATYTENGVQIVADKIIAIKAVMMGLSATCPSTINAGAGDSCSATASYSNDSSKAASASWSSSNPTVLSVNSSNGSLTAGAPVSDTPVTISASYSEGGVSKSATATVTVKGAPPPPFILTLICPFTMNAGSTASCSAMVGYANSTSNTVSASWSSNNPSVLGVNGGTLTAGNVTTDTPVTLTASYAENGVTKTATCTVTVKAAPPPFSLSISGVISLSSGQSASLSATAIYTNSTSKNVTGNVTWGLIGTGATIDAAGTITAQNVAADTRITVTASYSENGQPPQTAKKEITVQAAITLTGLELACPAGMTANSSGNCSAMAVYSDRKKTAVTPAIWSVSPSSAATIDASGKVTAAKVTADTPITVKASYTENGKTVSADKSITLQAAPCLANTGEISISGAAVKKLGESVDVRYRLCNFNSATKFDVYVAVLMPDGHMLFLSTSGFFGAPTFSLWDGESKPPAYLANTLVPDLEGAVLSLPVMPLTLPTGTYTFYAIPVLTGKDVMIAFNWVGSMAKSEVSLTK